MLPAGGTPASNRAIRVGPRPRGPRLDGTPFDSLMVPGILLLLVVALPMAVAAIAEIRTLGWAFAGSMVAGAAQLGWIVAQWLITGKYFFLQPVMLAAGAGVLVLAWLAHRGESLFRPRKGLIRLRPAPPAGAKNPLGRGLSPLAGRRRQPDPEVRRSFRASNARGKEESS